MSSIRIPAIVPPPLADCVELRKAFQGLGCNGVAVISILAHRNIEQRLQIKEAYGNLYQEDLMRRIKSELHFNFEKAMLLWMLDPTSRDAVILKDALRSHVPFSSSRRRRILIEMLCLQSGKDLCCISQAYRSSFNRSLLDDILASTEGFCRKLFTQYVVAKHDTSGVAEMDMNRTASEGAQALFEAMGGRAGCINDVAFLKILMTKSRLELLLIFNAYKNLYGKDVYKEIRKDATADTQAMIREVLKCISNTPRFFAKTLHKSMKGLGTEDDTLIRVVVTRAEVDMQDIKSEFIRKYKVSLDRTISSDTSGNYRNFLMALIGANQSPKESFLSKIL